jgi:hypothetical protein
MCKKAILRKRVLEVAGSNPVSLFIFTWPHDNLNRIGGNVNEEVISEMVTFRGR